jgi:hypothetical protein
LSELIKEKLDIDLTWTYKEHDNTFQVPEDFRYEAAPDEQQVFEKMAEEFEKTHCLIVRRVSTLGTTITRLT